MWNICGKKTKPNKIDKQFLFKTKPANGELMLPFHISPSFIFSYSKVKTQNFRIVTYYLQNGRPHTASYSARSVFHYARTFWMKALLNHHFPPKQLLYILYFFFKFWEINSADFFFWICVILCRYPVDGQQYIY